MTTDSSYELTLIKIMLKALLRNSNQLHSIGAYTGGRTSNGDAYILLYSANSKLNHKIVRVYEEAFHRLPDYIDTEIPANATCENPTREHAVKSGILKTCKQFEIITFDGRNTSLGPERRFYVSIKPK